ncbi:MAG: SAM-dependent methyltransferase [Acidobacteria bacterium]|nr:SAM-dependent methyltransferase [Acidobacteriota bacterium]
MSLRRVIAEEITARGPIPFSRYMELCLYHPELGYYMRAAEQFGKAGDFYTSSDVHAVFGRLLARQFEEMWRTLGRPARLDLIEPGPGRGLFARDVLDWSAKKFPEFFRALHYTLVERSEQLRMALEERLQAWIAEGKVSICESLEEGGTGQRPVPTQPVPTQSFATPSVAAHDVIVFANEFFDALPVEVVTREGEVWVNVRDERFEEVFVAPSAEVLEYVDRYALHPEAGERVEAGLAAQRRMARLAGVVKRGFFLMIDYGYTRDELLAGRHRGTVMAYRAHTASADPYEAPGEQDITAHVNFTALAAAGEQAGLSKLGLVTQSQFLMGIGESTEFADAFEDCKLPQEHAKAALQLKHLVTPAGMGETFHVLVMGKGVGREGISGLKFDV